MTSNDNSRLPLLVLAGGFGTRLRKEVPGIPKPLAPVGGVPFLSLLLELWSGAGIKDFIFLLHHEAEQIISFLEGNDDKLLAGCNWTTVVEPAPLGTGGAVANAVRELELQGSFLVANADTWLSEGILAMHATVAPAMGVLKVENTGRYGSVQINETGVITGFVEKSGAQGAGWINAGIYHLAAEPFLTWDGVAFSLEQDHFPQLLDNQRLQAISLQTEFIDIGIAEDYRRFSRWVESGRALPL